MAPRLADLLSETPYASYVYSYPHKTAYRPLTPPVPLEEVWAHENRGALFLYIHVPFCEMRCGFCNLFTAANPKDPVVDGYLDALERQAKRVKSALGEASFARFALGGGTPTVLEPASLARVLDVAERVFGADLRTLPGSVEVSPETLTRDKLTVLRERGLDRVSIGVQSFFDTEVRAVLRPQKRVQVEAALDAMRSAGFPTLNIDLMYGLPGQTPQTWIESLQAALRYQPEELYLYPLYVRPLTGLGRSTKRWDDERLELYRLGRDFLQSEGYTQISMRMFRSAKATNAEGPVYCCQDDGMVGLGSGARSYTADLHYSTEYAVGAAGVNAIIADYLRRDDAFGFADHGIRVTREERRRRYLILSLLLDGLDFGAYQLRFGTDARLDFPELSELEEHGLATRTDSQLTLTADGYERADVIGPWLFSDAIHTRMREYEQR